LNERIVQPPAPHHAVRSARARADEELGLSEILGWVVQNRTLLLYGALVGGLVMAAIALVQKPVYRAETVLAVVDQSERGGTSLSGLSGRLGALGNLVGGLDALSGDNRSEFIALLRSRAFTEKFIEDENLIPVLFPKRTQIFGAGRAPTIFRAYRFFDKDVRDVAESRATGLVTVGIEWEDPEAAARWANLMVARLNGVARQRAIAEARKSLEYLNHELTTTNVVEVRTAIYRLIEIQLSKITVATAREEYAFRVIDPARAPDRDYRVRPNRKLLTLLGMGAGAVIGAMIALVRAVRKEWRRP
jgi:uncharacterized protein involved in exopolysaccharide biosynthesis